MYKTYFHFFARIQWIKILFYFFFLYYFVCRLFFLLHISSTDSIFSTVHSFQSKMKNVQQTLKQSSLITDNSFSIEIRFSIDFQSLVNFSLFFSAFFFLIYTTIVYISFISSVWIGVVKFSDTRILRWQWSMESRVLWAIQPQTQLPWTVNKLVSFEGIINAATLK